MFLRNIGRVGKEKIKESSEKEKEKQEIKPINKIVKKKETKEEE